MITSYEVGAVLRVLDEASPALSRIAKAAKDLDKAILKVKESLEKLASSGFAGVLDRIEVIDKGFIGIGDAAAKGSKAAIESFANVDRSLATSIDGVKALKHQMAGIGTSAARINTRIAAAAAATPALASGSGGAVAAGGGAGAPPGIRTRGGWGHFGRMSVGAHGVSAPHYSMPSSPWMALAGALGFGVFEEGEVEDAATQILYHIGAPYTPENKDKFRAIIQATMAKTGETSLKEVAEAALTEVRMFKGTPGGGVDVMPEVLQAAAIESRLKGSSLEESMKSFIGLAHMTKEYSPEQIAKLAPAFAFLSSANPASLTSMERAASYAVPVLQSGLHVDPAETLLLGTVLTRAGATNTKSGTWLRNMALAAMPGTSLMSKFAFKKHEGALKELGLVDDHDEPTWFTNGHPDLIKMLEIAGPRAAALSDKKRAAYEKSLFGTQGFGSFALLADPVVQQQVAALNAEKNSPEFKSRYANFLDQYAKNSPMQAGRLAWADLQNSLMDLGKTVMPYVVKAINDFAKGIEDTNNQIRFMISAVKDVNDSLHNLGGAIGSAISGVVGYVADKIRGTGPVVPPRVPQYGPIHEGGWPGGPIIPYLEDPAIHSQMMRQHNNWDKPMTLGAPPPPKDPFFGPQSKNDTTIHNKTSVYLDGRIIGEAVSSQLAQLSMFPRQAAYGDPYVGWTSPDWQATG